MIARLKSKISSLLFTPNISSPVLMWGRGVLITSTIAIAILLGWQKLALSESFNLETFDQLTLLQPDEGKDSRLLIVGITEEDIQQLSSIPVSDEIIAEVLEKIQQHQPRVIGLDILRDIPIGEGRPALAKALAQPNIIGVCQISQTNSPGTSPPPELSFDQVGFADLPQDQDGIQRRTSLISYPPYPDESFSPQEEHLCNNPQQELISFAFALSLFYLEVEGIEAELTETEELKLGSTILQPLEEDTSGYQDTDIGDYQILINYRSASQPSEQVSITDILNDRVDPSLIRDRIVLIGYTASSAKDIFPTPYKTNSQENQLMPGVVIHAQIVSQILSSVLDNRPLYPQ